MKESTIKKWRRPQKVRKNVQTIHDSVQSLDELERYVAFLDIAEGRAYVQALTEKMDRDRAAGKFQ